jgi:hypothetical protein
MDGDRSVFVEGFTNATPLSAIGDFFSTFGLLARFGCDGTHTHPKTDEELGRLRQEDPGLEPTACRITVCFVEAEDAIEAAFNTNGFQLPSTTGSLLLPSPQAESPGVTLQAYMPKSGATRRKRVQKHKGDAVDQQSGELAAAPVSRGQPPIKPSMSRKAAAPGRAEKPTGLLSEDDSFKQMLTGLTIDPRKKSSLAGAGSHTTGEYLKMRDREVKRLDAMDAVAEAKAAAAAEQAEHNARVAAEAERTKKRAEERRKREERKRNRDSAEGEP